MSICRGFDPSAGHTIPISSKISIMRPARANPRPSLRWSIEVDAFCSLRMSSIADSIIFGSSSKLPPDTAHSKFPDLTEQLRNLEDSRASLDQ